MRFSRKEANGGSSTLQRAKNNVARTFELAYGPEEAGRVLGSIQTTEELAKQLEMAEYAYASLDESTKQERLDGTITNK